ncbi:MAG: SIMPL domain-containing protein [Chloroflexaceae bacterium]|nr:SIMPL domain-containing protein [Chloroflexaceae bacterium]NJO04549.1 SIMPL domain-containing protein [Chloroflexaceae bacterium]
MSNRLTVFMATLTGVLLIALVVGVTTLLVGRPVQAQTTGVTGMRQITVVGSGDIAAAPDTVQVEIGVETLAPTTAEAIAQNNTQTQAVIERLTALGIERRDIQTRNFNMYAQYGEDGREITGYNVSNIVSVVIRDLEQAGTLLDEVVQVGANRIYGITFRVDDPSALLEQARDEAIQDARAKAERLAQASGAGLGQVLVITENIGAAPPMPMAFGRGGAVAEDMAASVPVEAGEQSFTASVQVTFELR